VQGQTSVVCSRKMPLFVHIARLSLAERLVRNGVRGSRYLVLAQEEHKLIPRAVFCMPIVSNYFTTYQWVREIRRNNHGPLAAVVFRLDDAEELYWGHYNKDHQLLPAASVAAAGRIDDVLGYEAILPRSITGAEITGLRHIPQGVGWRYFPGSHGHKPCGCDYCTKGAYKARRLREDYRRQK
jgi:hypothetical protein